MGHLSDLRISLGQLEPHEYHTRLFLLELRKSSLDALWDTTWKLIVTQGSVGSSLYLINYDIFGVPSGDCIAPDFDM